MAYIYADNAATTRLSDAAFDAMKPFMLAEYGNASTLYKLGRSAHKAVENARGVFAKGINALPAEIYFTSGGTESDNWAIKGTAHRLASCGKKHIVTDNIEHHAVLNSAKALEREGFEVTYVSADKNGLVRAEDVAAAIRPDTAMVSVMFANNELGTIQPVAEIGSICRSAGVLFHCDAVQAAGILPIDVKAMNIDLLSISAHKFHGPKGVGVMYARRGCVPETYIDGGEQERGHRAGTENVAGIVGAAAAFAEAMSERDEKAERLCAMRDEIQSGLMKIPGAQVNGGAAPRLPGTLNMSFDGIDGQSLIFELDLKGLAASSGSACASGSVNPSHVLLALGLPYKLAHGSLRLSLGKYNTPDEAERIIRIVSDTVAELRG
jgi:cysteine desulfurase